MAKDPGFKFYPGDYLRDTQCLSEPVQVAYDRIMCEHMRNICISQERHNFFTKRLSASEKEELNNVLIKCDEGYYIEWVRESILKGRAYSESRANNREGKKNPKLKKDILTYVPHMDNDNDNDNDIDNEKENKKGVQGEKFLVTQMWETWKSVKPKYPADKKKDFPPLLKIAEFICGQERIIWMPSGSEETVQILTIWRALGDYIDKDKFFAKYSLEQVERHIQSISQSFQENKPKTFKDIQNESRESVEAFFRGQ